MFFLYNILKYFFLYFLFINCDIKLTRSQSKTMYGFSSLAFYFIFLSQIFVYTIHKKGVGKRNHSFFPSLPLSWFFSSPSSFSPLRIPLAYAIIKKVARVDLGKNIKDKNMGGEVSKITKQYTPLLKYLSRLREDKHWKMYLNYNCELICFVSSDWEHWPLSEPLLRPQSRNGSSSNGLFAPTPSTIRREIYSRGTRFIPEFFFSRYLERLISKIFNRFF